MCASSTAAAELGLSSAEAARRLAVEGYNELTPPRRRGIATLLLEVAREPMFLLLVAAGSIYLLLGSVSEALMLLFFVFFIMTLTVLQERRTERVLEALRDLSSPRALVVRDGRPQRIAGREVVRGDILLFAEGDRVAADAVLLECNDLAANESVLTGESVPVRKLPWAGRLSAEEEAAGAEPGGDDQPFVYAGTVLVQGGGVARVTATGSGTAIGRIGKALESTPPSRSPLHAQMRALVRRLAIAASLLSLLLVVLYGLSHGDWLQALLAGITLAMAALPEEFPVILSVFLALGAWRISRSRVLTRRADAIETLGATTVLCTDKTGTLTENRMAIRRIYCDGNVLTLDDATIADLPEAFHALIEFGILASEREPFDPMERALHELGRSTLAGTEHLHGAEAENGGWELVHEYSLSPDLLAMSHVWRGGGIEHDVVAAKGAPEAIVDLCHLPPSRADAALRAAAAMADQGLRVLGIAAARLDRMHDESAAATDWPRHQHDIDYEFAGFIGLEDPLRAGVAEAIAAARGAGVRVVMITGDYPRTAQAIARQLGLPAQRVVTGADLHAMDDATLCEHVRDVDVFARIVPQQKLRLVEAFKANGEIVAMTGDGVNDAPALKAAHIGVAMGARGTDVAREAAALVLLDDDFNSLVATVRLGRRIFDNLRKAVSYTVAVHVPIVGMSLAPVLLGQPLLLLPAHIVFLELIIDPACSVAFEAEAEEADVMRRPPRDPRQPMFGGSVLVIGALMGLVALATSVAIYALALRHGFPDGEVRALVFLSIVSGNLALVLANRSAQRGIVETLCSRNPAFWWVLLAAASGLLLVLAVPWLRELFSFAPLSLPVAAAGIIAGLLVLPGSALIARFLGRGQGRAA